MNKNIKALIVSFGPLILIVVLFVFTLRFSLSKISDLRTKISTERKNETVLTERLNLLTEVEGEALASSSISLSALPATNPSLVVISQLKRLSTETGVIIESIKSGSETKDKSGLKRVDITFEALGPRTLVMQFLQRVGNIAPLSLVDKVKMSEAGGTARATVTVKSFWADLPTKLPPLDMPINDLTTEERNTFSTVSTLTQPLFLEVVPSESSGRSDPFSP